MVILWNANRNLLALYRLVLFPVILSDPNYSNHPVFDILYRLPYFVVNGVRDFKFGR